MITFTNDMKVELYFTEKNPFNPWEYQLIGKPTKVELISRSYNQNERIYVDFNIDQISLNAISNQKRYFLLIGESSSRYCIVLFRCHSYITLSNTMGAHTCEISGKIINAIEGDGNMPVISDGRSGTFGTFDLDRVTRIARNEPQRGYIIQYPVLYADNIFSPKFKVMECISKIIFNPPATVIYWSDGTKTTCKAMDGDTFSKEIGVAMCIAKKFFGNSRSQFKHSVYDLAEDYSKQAEAIAARKAKKKRAQEESNAQIDNQ